jgi:hypothetical protein
VRADFASDESHVDLEGARERSDRGHWRIGLSALDPTDFAPRDARELGELRLREPALVAARQDLAGEGEAKSQRLKLRDRGGAIGVCLGVQLVDESSERCRHGFFPTYCAQFAGTAVGRRYVRIRVGTTGGCSIFVGGGSGFVPGTCGPVRKTQRTCPVGRAADALRRAGHRSPWSCSPIGWKSGHW